MPEERSELDSPRPSLTTVTFQRSVPMVTYLACFIVCDFKFQVHQTLSTYLLVHFWISTCLFYLSSICSTMVTNSPTYPNRESIYIHNMYISVYPQYVYFCLPANFVVRNIYSQHGQLVNYCFYRIYRFIGLSIDISIHLSIYLLIHLSTYLSIYLSIHLLIYLSTYLSIYPACFRRN